MSWAKLDDGFWMHPKILGAGNAAAGIFARMLSYCGCYLTDGLVPAGVVQTIVGRDKAALEALTASGMLQPLDSGGVIVSDYLDFNRSKAQVEADRDQRRENGKHGGRPRGHK